MKRTYVGLANSFHDSALAIVSDAGEPQFRKAFRPPTGFVRRQPAGLTLFLREQLAIVAHPGSLLEFELAHSEWFANRDIHWRGFEHHRTHAAAGCFSNMFDDAVCTVFDGIGV